MEHAAATTETVTEDWSSIVQVPAPEASFANIVEFSHTYDAYGVHGSLERISMISDEVFVARQRGALADCELDDLRTALFMTQRGWHQAGEMIDVESHLGYEWELVNAIDESSGGFVRDDRPILL
jgi:hypothetical protein